VQIIEISFVIVYRIFDNKIIAVFGVSAAVTVCTAPLYFMAEKWQKVERELQEKLRSKVKKIKAVFKGDEQYMVLSAYYRQNHYHPVYALRSSLGVLIQIPFFLAAYSYLSNLDLLKGVQFTFIQDLGEPDRLISLNGFHLNFLPIVMTIINCAAGALYTKGFNIREKIQIYGMAFCFLFLLYNSPSALVLYWTMNNIFSLIKNILSKTKHWPKVIYVILCLCALLIDIRFIILGFSPKRLFAAGYCSLVFLAPLFLKIFRIARNSVFKKIKPELSPLSLDSTFVLSALILFCLTGLVIPGSLIASSVQEFSFLDSFSSPLPFIFTIFTQTIGGFLFWPLCIYFLFPKKIKYFLAMIISFFSVTALINTFIFPGDYGSLSITFRFFNPDTFESKFKLIIISYLAFTGILCGFICLILTSKKYFFRSFQLIVLASLVFLGVYYLYKIDSGFKDFAGQKQQSGISVPDSGDPEPVYHFSRNGKNVIVIMLDAAISGYIPYIFNEKPELLKDFSGFTYFPNCVSLGNHSRIGAPVLFGGYEYEPRFIQKNRSYAMQKHNEALLMMPRIFLQAGYQITVTDPVFANYSWKPDLSVFSPYSEITAMNIIGNYTGMWLRQHPELNIISIPELLQELLIRFSLIKIFSPAFRVFIYDKGEWLKSQNNFSDQLSLNTLDSYTTLDYIPLITSISDGEENTYTAIVNELTHDAAIFQYPDYVPKKTISYQGSGLFAEEKTYHAIMASFLLLGKWFRFLQEQGVYDNARIVIASDHGSSMDNEYSGNMLLPNRQWLSSYHALLLVKDFMSEGEPATDTEFMTHGDVPFIAMNNLIDNPRNPFSNYPITTDKKNGVKISTSSVLQFRVPEDEWLFVHDNIFDPNNWEKAVEYLPPLH
jgi:YidC/Oxa1 family membrane protein insertase